MYKILPKRDLDSSERLLDEEATLESEKAQSRSFRHYIPTFQQIFNVVAFLYILISFPTIFSAIQRHRAQTYSPVNHLITYERQPLHEDHEVLEQKGFVGDPEDTDPNWRQLLEPMNFKATESELHQANISINDEVVRVSGGGYVGVLSVYHELHCLDALRRSTLRSYYYANMTASGLDHDARVIGHLTHCIEYIRRTVMCHADVSLYTATWIADSHENPNKDLISGSERECVNWDAIDTWSRSRALKKRVYKVKPGPFEKNLHPGEDDTSRLGSGE